KGEEANCQSPMTDELCGAWVLGSGYVHLMSHYKSLRLGLSVSVQSRRLRSAWVATRRGSTTPAGVELLGSWDFRGAFFEFSSIQICIIPMNVFGDLLGHGALGKFGKVSAQVVTLIY
ncbi:hypothetical protein Ancab_014261, partial [Ancistrocladus abbreviatus]